MSTEKENVQLKVGGMTCAMCVKTVERSLGRVAGVSEVNVNLASELAYVTFDPQLARLDDMHRAIEDAGYQFLGLAGEQLGDEETRRRQYIKGMKWRVIVGFSSGIPLLVAMLAMAFSTRWSRLFILGVTMPIVLYLCAPVFRGAWRGLRGRILNMELMYALGIGVAWISSILASIDLLPADFLFYDTVLLLASFLTLGKLLETRAIGRMAESIRQLIALQPKTALVIRPEGEREIPLAELRSGDRIKVRPGEKVPADGVVIQGESHVDESMISGEPMPVLKSAGQELIGGTLNREGVLVLEAKKVGRDTLLSQIILMVREAQGTKPPIQRIADKAVSYFIPVILAIALITFFAWYFLAGSTFLFALTALISVLVISCPCALGLATPAALVAGIGRGAELGILIRNGEALEKAEKINVVVFDKTGTLTRGRPEVVAMRGVGMENDELLRLAAAVEKNSLHPLAEAIVRQAQEKGVALPVSEGFTSVAGRGLSAMVSGRKIIVGSQDFLQENGVTGIAALSSTLAELAGQGRSLVLLAANGQVGGVFGIADPLKPRSARAVAELERLGLAVAMITGDNEQSAIRVANEAGIHRVIARTLPQDKEAQIRRLQEQGERVAFVGDGINDAPALARADLGIAMGQGTDVAVASGDIVLMHGDPLDAVSALQLSRKVLRRVRQNLFWAFAYNGALVPLAAGLLYRPLGLMLPPAIAGLAMAASSITVLSLSLALKRYLPPAKRIAV